MNEERSSSTSGDDCTVRNIQNEQLNENLDSQRIYSPFGIMHTPSEKYVLRVKLKEILSCRVCSELRRTAIYQCKYGHLICAGCFGDILAESRLQNEIASCPVCQTTITKDLCSRNVAVEKTISELPMKCKYCSEEFAADACKHHEIEMCELRPKACSNYIIGCGWRGPFYQKVKHERLCIQPLSNGYDILKSLTLIDKEQKEEIDLYEKIMELLSCEKFTHCDLQFKKCENGNVVSLYETHAFSALENQWIVRCQTDSERFNFKYQLAVKTKLNNPISMHYLILRGPYSEMEIAPKLYQFKFSDKSMESQYECIVLANESDYKNFLSAKRINFRIFMFISK